MIIGFLIFIVGSPSLILSDRCYLGVLPIPQRLRLPNWHCTQARRRWRFFHSYGRLYEFSIDSFTFWFHCLLGLNQKEETVAIEILVASAHRALNENLAGRFNKRQLISRPKLRAKDVQAIAENRRRLTDRLVRCLTPMILKVPIVFELNLFFFRITVYVFCYIYFISALSYTVLFLIILLCEYESKFTCLFNHLLNFVIYE